MSIIIHYCVGFPRGRPKRPGLEAHVAAQGTRPRARPRTGGGWRSALWAQPANQPAARRSDPPKESNIGAHATAPRPSTAVASQRRRRCAAACRGGIDRARSRASRSRFRGAQRASRGVLRGAGLRAGRPALRGARLGAPGSDAEGAEAFPRRARDRRRGPVAMTASSGSERTTWTNRRTVPCSRRNVSIIRDLLTPASPAASARAASSSSMRVMEICRMISV